MRVKPTAFARRFLNRPLMLDPGSIEPLMLLEGWSESIDRDEAMRPYRVIAGVAVIQISGALVQKLGYPRGFSFLTGYDGISANISMALEDESVQAILLDIDSRGGEVAGCFDLVDAIYAVRGAKPIWSILSEVAYSAAYAIASATDQIIVPRTGGTGSVGVIAMHCDFSKMLENMGIDVTVIQYGARKADGNEVSPLSKEARQRYQAEIDEMGELFVDTVARNRGLKASKVRATEASSYLGAAGVEIGFADAVMAPDAAFRALLKQLG